MPRLPPIGQPRTGIDPVTAWLGAVSRAIVDDRRRLVAGAVDAADARGRADPEHVRRRLHDSSDRIGRQPFARIDRLEAHPAAGIGRAMNQASALGADPQSAARIFIQDRSRIAAERIGVGGARAEVLEAAAAAIEAVQAFASVRNPELAIAQFARAADRIACGTGRIG